MSLEKLRETEQSIENLDRLNSGLSSKIEIAEQERYKEESTYNLLKYELSQLTKSLQEEKSQVNKLKTRQERLSKSYQDAFRSLKSFQNYSFVNSIRLEMKAQSKEKVQQKLDVLDFDNEARQCDPTQAYI